MYSKGISNLRSKYTRGLIILGTRIAIAIRRIITSNNIRAVKRVYNTV